MMGTVDQARDTYCVDSLVTGRLATGKTLVGQRCYHRLSTPRGRLRGGEDEANFGLDLAGYVGRVEERQLVSTLPVVVKNELLKDPFVDAVSTDVLRVDEGGGRVSWKLTITITTTDGDVTLSIAVADLTVQLLGIF